MKRQNGVISLVTSIMVSILLITLALGLLVLNNGANQQASDDELSLRAYAAAVGGIEWAFAKLAADPSLTYDNCSGVGSAAAADANIPNVLSTVAAGGSGGTQNAITCLLVKTVDNKVTGTLDHDDSNQVTIDPQSPVFANIVVSWIDNNNPQDQPYPAGGYNGYSGALPAGASAGQPPAVELTIVNYATTPASNPRTINPGSITVRNVVLLPHTSNLAVSPSKILVGCSNNTAYACSTTVNAGNSGALGADDGVIVFLRSMYSNGVQSFHYQLQLQKSDGSLINVPLSTATIDVTARSGPVYRRIVAHAPIGKNVVPAGLNYVLFGDQNICKDFSVNTPGGGGAQNITSLCNGQP